MPARPAQATTQADVRQVLLEIYAANEVMNDLIFTNLNPRAWRARLPGAKASEGRTIAAIFAHLHNCRLVWIKRSAPHLKCPAPLNPARCTIKQAAAAHRRSNAACLKMLTDALSDNPARRVTIFSRDSWTRVWPAGATMFAYMFAHEAHHRGQVIMLAHQLGFRLPIDGAYGIWHWDKLWKRLGFTARPR